MTRKQQRIYAIGLILSGCALAVGLALFALRDNVTFFYSPSDIKGVHTRFVPPDRPFRLGGMVSAIERDGRTVRFTVTDHVETIEAVYDGITPDLFVLNSGVVATGRLNDAGVFEATQLLARHDEQYMPPEVAKALERAHDGRAETGLQP